ncbi:MULTISPECIES: heavy metal translocating P-type ATPase [unclassified Nitrospina]|uniref:heavy metal translocating P-type ATPase n=1 Tax=unclassified Nitrospina TaxID=2638683 RepID=UPI003F97DD2D
MPDTKTQESKSLSLPIQGMSCASCAARIEKKVGEVPGVSKVSVNFGAERAAVDYDPETATPDAIISTIQKIGFDVPSVQKTFPVEGMTCASCVGRVEKKLRGLDGVVDVSVNLASERATVNYMEARVGLPDFRTALADIGYSVPDVESEAETATQEAEEARHQREYRALQFKFASSLGLAVAIMTLGMTGWVENTSTLHWLLFVLATPVQFWGGWQFYKGTWAGLKHGYADMNTLIAVGTTVAYAYSVAVTVLPELAASFGTELAVYYDTSAMIIALVLMGRMLEARAKGRTSDAIRKLMGMQARTARVERNGEEHDLPIDQVEVGDIVSVRPGERVPVDGTITEGQTAIDESMISGESVPVEKKEGDDVIGASINKTGYFKMKATRLGRDSVLAHIIRMVQEAQGSKAPVQRLVDKVAGVFVPVVIGIALVAFGFWWLAGPSVAALPTEPGLFAMMIFISVMIIACPCALGLATPTAIMVGTGKGAEMGVLIKGGETLEQAQKLNTIVFDKTGTLTEGKPVVRDVWVAEGAGLNEDTLLMYAASLEKGSEHPLGVAIVEHAKEKNVSLKSTEGFEALPGFGVKAKVDGHDVALGNLRMMQDAGLDVEAVREKAETFAGEGRTAMLVQVDGRIVGIIAAADRVRPESKSAIQSLKQRGLEIVMITGDNQKTAEAVGGELGIDRVLAEVLPADKAQQVKRLQDEGRFVAMVGDGINDAPALAQANIGIAMGSGTDVAIETADITLMTHDLNAVVDAIELSRRTMSKIRQNLFWAFFYNVLGIPIAAGVLYPFNGVLLQPMFAAAAMSFSSVSVVSNSLLLKRFTSSRST